MSEQPPDDAGHRRGWPWAVAAGLAGIAASTLATALAAAVAGRQSDLALQPVELALRVGLLLIAPCVGAVLASSGLSADQIFGSLDAMKVRSSMTLFHRAAPDEPLFAEVLERFYGGVADETTDALVGNAGPVTGDR